MRCFFVYNPVSGRGKIAKKLDYIVRKLGEKYDTVDVYATQKTGDMERAAREAADKYDAIIFSGGDGSFNEVVQGIGSAEFPPELGYIPSGTVNDIAHTLGIPKSLRGAVKTVLTGDNVLVDCMKINDRHAMYVVAAGAFTSASYTTPQTEKKRVGRLAYGIEGIKKNLKFQVFKVKIKCGEKCEETESVFVIVMNGRYVAGTHLNKKGSIADGKLELAVIRQQKDPNVFKKIRALLALAHLFIFGYRVPEKQITRFTGAEFEIEADESVVWNFDGEKGVSGSVKICVLPKKINMIVPKGTKNI